MDVLREDSVQTIGRISNGGVTIYTDGSAVGGVSLGGSAAVVTRGDPSEPVRLEVWRQKGRRVTSSFETEVSALLLAVGWLEENHASEPATICVDSQAALKAVLNARSGEGEVAKVRARLSCLLRPVTLQWVPGHVGVTGNEWADVEANAAAGRGAGAAGNEESCPLRVIEEVGDALSYSAASAVLKVWSLSPRAMKERVRAV